MDIDLVLAIAHHLAVFTLVAVFAVEFAMIRPGLAGPAIQSLSRIDAVYGAFAGIVILVGVIRLFFGAKGWDYYAANEMFWGKMAAFLLVGLLSIPPSIAIRRWAKGLAGSPTYLPPPGEIASSRRFIHLQAAFLVLIPVFAAAMARSYGLS
jgi:putative membrane protein